MKRLPLSPLFLLLGVILVFASLTNAECDYEPYSEYIEELRFNNYPRPIALPQWPEYSYVRICTHGTAEGLVPINGKWQLATGAYHLNGVGFVIKDKYIVTAAHIVEPHGVCFAFGLYSHFCTYTLRTLTREIYVGSVLETGNSYEDLHAEIFLLDLEHDLAILKIVGSPFIPLVSLEHEIECSLWNCSACQYGMGGLEVGDAVATIVRTRDEDHEWEYGFEVRYGKVVSPTVLLPETQDNPHGHTWFNMWDFTTDLTVYPGDSGSPVFAFSNGKPVLIGVLRAASKEHMYAIHNKYGYVVRLHLFDRLEDIFS